MKLVKDKIQRSLKTESFLKVRDNITLEMKFMVDGQVSFKVVPTISTQILYRIWPQIYHEIST
jgi:hypothetical protein